MPSNPAHRTKAKCSLAIGITEQVDDVARLRVPKEARTALDPDLLGFWLRVVGCLRKAIIDTTVAIDVINPKTGPYCAQRPSPGTSRYRRA
jgi:hypothetical protein